MANLFLVPKKIVTGKDALESAGPYLKELGDKALIVTDRVMVSTGNVEKLTTLLTDNNIRYVVFDGIHTEPTTEMVSQGIEVYQETNCNFLIGIGGGSPIDAMKAIGAMITNTGKLTDYMGKELKNPPPPLVAIPTTAGTGSEATQFTIISDIENHVKMLLKGAVLLPSLAVVDPVLTVTAPPKVTAATGLDALTHAVEAYTSRKAQALSDIFAVSACKRIFAHLKTAYQNGQDLEARNQMVLAALEAGIAFNNSSVTIVHGMSRPIGALFHVPHGISNAMLLEECLRFAAAGAPERFAELAQATGIAGEPLPYEAAAGKLIDEIGRLCRDLEVPSLEAYGVDRTAFGSNLDKMAGDALISGSPNHTIRQPSKEDIITIYKKLWK